MDHSLLFKLVFSIILLSSICVFGFYVFVGYVAYESVSAISDVDSSEAVRKIGELVKIFKQSSE